MDHGNCLRALCVNKTKTRYAGTAAPPFACVMKTTNNLVASAAACNGHRFSSRSVAESTALHANRISRLVRAATTRDPPDRRRGVPWGLG